MTYVLGFCMALLFIASLLVLMRIFRGPTALERMVALDVMTSVVIGAVALLAALTRREDLLALFVALALVGFVGSTTLARFITPGVAKRYPERRDDARRGAAPNAPGQSGVAGPSGVGGLNDAAQGATGRNGAAGGSGVVVEGRQP